MKKKRNKNPVAKNMNKFHKPATMRDRKNDYTRKVKHKKAGKNLPSFLSKIYLTFLNT